MPTLNTLQGLATTAEAKCEALKARFFLPFPAADFSALPDFQCPVEKFSSSSILLNEIASALSKALSYIALGPDGLQILFHKLLGKSLLKFLQPLFQACLQFSYHHLHFKQSSTFVLMKSGKVDCSASAAWQPN
jgi:hypothetical protein